VTDAAKESYPVETRMLEPIPAMLFYRNPLTPEIKPVFLYLPR